MDVVRNDSNQLTVVCGDLDSDCILSFKSNQILKYVNFEPNTTSTLSFEEKYFSSASFIEISSYLNSTQFVWVLNYSGM